MVTPAIALSWEHYTNSTVSGQCTAELVCWKLLAISTISVSIKPRRDRNDDLKPLGAREKRSSRLTTEKTDRSEVLYFP